MIFSRLSKPLAIGLSLLAAGLLAFVAGWLFASRRSPPVREEPLFERAAGEERGPAGETGYRLSVPEVPLDGRSLKTMEVESDREEKWGQGAIHRGPLGEAVLVILVDSSAAAGSESLAAARDELAAGVADFIRAAPPGLVVGVRALGSGKDAECRDTRLVTMPTAAPYDPPDVRELTPGGPRNLARGLYQALEDMAARRGRKGIAVLAYGGEECREWPCKAAEAFYGSGDAVRTWTVKLEPPPPAEAAPSPANGEGPRPSSGAETAAPVETGSAPPAPQPVEPVEPVAPPPVTAPAAIPAMATDDLSCMAGSGGGARTTARTRGEIAAALRAMADDLAKNVTVRLYRDWGEELTGLESPGFPAQVAVTLLGSGPLAEMASKAVPARFSLGAGSYRVTGRYRDTRATVDGLLVGPGQRIELRLMLRAGTLVIEAGPVSWPSAAEGECLPTVTVTRAGGGESSTMCGLPARFLLAPGTYSVTAQGGETVEARGVAVAEGRTTLIRVSPGLEPAMNSVDK